MQLSHISISSVSLTLDFFSLSFKMESNIHFTTYNIILSIL